MNKKHDYFPKNPLMRLKSEEEAEEKELVSPFTPSGSLLEKLSKYDSLAESLMSYCKCSELKQFRVCFLTFPGVS